MTTASLIPDTIDKLVALATTALGTTGAVVDGPGAADVSHRELLLHVGTSDVDDDGYGATAESDQEWAYLGHLERRAEFTVFCSVVAWNGSGNQKESRDKATTALQAFTDTMTADPTLDGVVHAVTGIRGINYSQIQDKEGAATKITFGITIQAWLT